MAITTKEQEIKRLRSYLNPLIKGKVTDAVLDALAAGSSSYLVNSIAQVHDQLYLATASGKFLDQLTAEFELTRNPSVGIGDDVYRQIAIEIKNRKAVRDLINQLLLAMFGQQLVQASSPSRSFETYHLKDGDTLILAFDDQPSVTILFTTGEFSSIAAATAQEVADAITKSLRRQNHMGTAVLANDGNGNYVKIYSDTIGPASSVQVLGGRAQNELKFDAPVPAGGNLSTQWTLSQRSGGFIRFTWTGGANPGLGKLSVGDYANIYGGGFASTSNEGSYTITDFIGGALSTSYFEVYNPLGTPAIITQGTNDAILFFNPVKRKVTSQTTYAAQFQVNPRTVQVFLPAVTKVVRRERQGSAHLHDTTTVEGNLPGQPGPYIYNTAQPFTISATGTTLAQNLDGTNSKLITVANASAFPDAQGYLIFGYGTQNQEGPIPYISRPSSNTLLLSPAYGLKNTFTNGTDVALVATRAPVVLDPAGNDFEFFLTGNAAGRIYAQSLINQIAATGLTVIFTVIYPADTGLGKWGTKYSEITTVYGQ
jgi:hypothetical protein